jgi:hypothetical protein
MRQTQLLKLDAPYSVVWDEKGLRMCKHVATLIEICEDDNGSLSTKEHVVTEKGEVWCDGELQTCVEVCTEHGSISMKDFYYMLLAVPVNEWYPNGMFSTFSLASNLRHYGIRIDFSEVPSVQTPDGKVIEVPLMMGVDDKGVYWVEDSVLMPFYFGGRKNSLSELREYIRYARNEYYRSFPEENFCIRIVAKTTNAELIDMVDEINKTAKPAAQI